jgi:hypothetical protein
MAWLTDARKVFSSIDKEVILSAYKDVPSKSLGFVRGRFVRKNNFDAEALLLGNTVEVKQVVEAPKEYDIFVNSRLSKVRNPLLRKQIVQSILIHELLHIEAKDLFTLSKDYSRRKKKKIHINDFEQRTFERYNQLRELNGLPRIVKKEYLDEAISKILQSIGWS